MQSIFRKFASDMLIGVVITPIWLAEIIDRFVARRMGLRMNWLFSRNDRMMPFWDAVEKTRATPPIFWLGLALWLVFVVIIHMGDHLF